MTSIMIDHHTAERQARLSQAATVTPIDRARERFGRPFAHELGSNYHMPRIPVLLQWLAERAQTR